MLYGSKRDGIRQLIVMTLADRREMQLTDLQPGYEAMWPHWQPVSLAGAERVGVSETSRPGRVLHNLDGDS